MNVEQEISSAKKQIKIGILLIIIITPFILASLVLGLYDYGRYHDFSLLTRPTSFIYLQTQIPIASAIWAITAQPNFIDVLTLQNFFFFAEIAVLFVGLAMVGGAGKTLRDIAEAEHKAKQQKRQDQFHNR
ncbi:MULTISPECIES: hypothetical protein [Pseudomonas syringae group]|uniref:hypothetical protein n=1 Tax=Pseudomonas syringae group TaxID=136849 RepID=UPI000EFFD8A5|nr:MULTISPECIES: hypothetical protein [Pseudomonas syringae group]MBI6739671.1 hypothetical protein [Pseudomonas syringae]MBI6762890.1 hypothetical protein [Pseudomonas syringae]MBI6826173.1 hypothetical protein [Pseudomonas syringae]MCF5712444.1 hypothetical protein [Pseudomonas tremae]UQB32573.1 hypothetical protein I9H06_04650 [Pseudomonas tremae]